MQVVSINQLIYKVKDRTLLDVPSLHLAKGKKVGLIGRNGQGKSTLLKLIYEAQFQKQPSIQVNGKVSFLPQLKLNHSMMSGGETSSDYFVRLLKEASELYLIDEPTTHLDLSHMAWVKEKLQEIKSTCIIVSHDRQLLDEVVDEIRELESGRISVYSGNYTDYIEQKQNLFTHEQKEYEKYIHKKNQLEQAIDLKKRKATKATKKPKNISSSEARLKGSKPYFTKKQKKT